MLIKHTIDPISCILPLVAWREESENVEKFLGTCFFAGSRIAVTCEHVIRSALGQRIGIVKITGVGKQYYVNVIAADANIDVALLEIPGFEPSHRFEFADEGKINGNRPVFTHEYGPTRTINKTILLDHATRVGNVTRTFTEPRYNKAGEDCHELSFPALQGASGAPVLDEGFRVLGMIMANVAYHLIPAQIETVVGDDNEVLETVEYMLPQGVAVNHKHIRAFMEKHKCL